MPIGTPKPTRAAFPTNFLGILNLYAFEPEERIPASFSWADFSKISSSVLLNELIAISEIRINKV
jgi:hypothetical protein